MKDNFSEQARDYAQFRPQYPVALYDFLLSRVAERQTAWDCGTGNGQVAGVLADHFTRVYATDISEKQLQHAVAKPNLTYQVAKAEQASFPDQTFDLITVAQAIHWFDFEAFYAEVKRTLKPQGVIAIVGYSLFSIRPPIDRIIQRLYADTLRGYWDPERKYVDEHYQTIPFPFREIEPPALAMTGEWTLDECVGYLNTWSAVQHYLRKNNDNPVGRTREELQEHWEENTRETVTFPLLLRVGKQA